MNNTPHKPFSADTRSGENLKPRLFLARCGDEVDSQPVDVSKFSPEFQQYYRNQGLTDEELEFLRTFFETRDLGDFKASSLRDLDIEIYKHPPEINAKRLYGIAEMWKFLFRHPSGLSESYKDSFIQAALDPAKQYPTPTVEAARRVKAALEHGFKTFDSNMDVDVATNLKATALTRLEAKHYERPDPTAKTQLSFRERLALIFCPSSRH